MVKIVGKEKINYFSKKNQRDVTGYKIHTCESSCPNVEGFRCDIFFVSDEIFSNYFDLPLGTEIEVYYNRYGNATGCCVMSGKE